MWYASRVLIDTVAILSSVAFVPGIVQLFMVNKTEGFSVTMLCILALAYLAFSIYGFFALDFIVIVFSMITMFMIVVMIIRIMQLR